MYITAADLAGFDVAGTSEATITKWITKAETSLARKLRKRGVNLAELASDPARLPDVKDILENAVLRVLRNPEGARTESEGDYSIGYNPLDAAGNVWFPKEDLDDLAPAKASVGTIRLGVPAHRLPPRRCW